MQLIRAKVSLQLTPVDPTAQDKVAQISSPQQVVHQGTCVLADCSAGSMGPEHAPGDSSQPGNHHTMRRYAVGLSADLDTPGYCQSLVPPFQKGTDCGLMPVPSEKPSPALGNEDTQQEKEQLPLAASAISDALQQEPTVPATLNNSPHGGAANAQELAVEGTSAVSLDISEHWTPLKVVASLVLFLVAAVAKIGGRWLVWQVMSSL